MTKTELLVKVSSKIHPKLYCYLPNITFLLSHLSFFCLHQKHPPPCYTVHTRFVHNVLKGNNLQGSKMLHFGSNFYIFYSLWSRISAIEILLLKFHISRLFLVFFLVFHNVFFTSRIFPSHFFSHLIFSCFKLFLTS